MENASKALIIAGAILLAILIISLGIIIFSQAESVVDSNAMSELEMQQFNTKFTRFEGSAVRGATVNTMLQQVLNNNLSQDDDARKVSVEIDNKTGEDAKVTLQNTATTLPTGRALTSATYTVTCTRGSSGSSKGLVISIKAEKNT